MLSSATLGKSSGNAPIMYSLLIPFQHKAVALVRCECITFKGNERSELWSHPQWRKPPNYHHPI